MVHRIPEDKVREDRILFEIVVDAHDETERAMGWYYYLQDELQVPFAAICLTTRSTSPLKVGDKVEVLEVAAEDTCMHEIHVLIKYGTSKLAVPLGQLECKSPREENCQAVADWHYWQARGYEY